MDLPWLSTRGRWRREAEAEVERKSPKPGVPLRRTLLPGAWPRAPSREAGGHRGDLACETEAPCVGLDELGLSRAHGASVGGEGGASPARSPQDSGGSVLPWTWQWDRPHVTWTFCTFCGQVSWGELWVRGHGQRAPPFQCQGEGRWGELGQRARRAQGPP